MDAFLDTAFSQRDTHESPSRKTNNTKTEVPPYLCAKGVVCRLPSTVSASPLHSTSRYTIVVCAVDNSNRSGR